VDGHARQIRRGRIDLGARVFRTVTYVAIGDAVPASMAQEAEVRRGGSDAARVSRARLTGAGTGIASPCDRTRPAAQAHPFLPVSQQTRANAAGSPRQLLDNPVPY